MARNWLTAGLWLGLSVCAFCATGKMSIDEEEFPDDPLPAAAAKAGAKKKAKAAPASKRSGKRAKGKAGAASKGGAKGAALAKVVGVDIDGAKLAVRSADGAEASVPVGEKTQFTRGPENVPISLGDIKAGDTVRYVMTGARAASVHVNVYVAKAAKAVPKPAAKGRGAAAARPKKRAKKAELQPQEEEDDQPRVIIDTERDEASPAESGRGDSEPGSPGTGPQNPGSSGVAQPSREGGDEEASGKPAPRGGRQDAPPAKNPDEDQQ